MYSSEFQYYEEKDMKKLSDYERAQTVERLARSFLKAQGYDDLKVDYQKIVLAVNLAEIALKELGL